MDMDHHCPCGQVDNSEMVWCDYCNNWIHFACAMTNRRQVEQVISHFASPCCQKCKKHTSIPGKGPQDLQAERQTRSVRDLYAGALGSSPNKNINLGVDREEETQAEGTATNQALVAEDDNEPPSQNQTQVEESANDQASTSRGMDDNAGASGCGDEVEYIEDPQSDGEDEEVLKILDMRIHPRTGARTFEVEFKARSSGRNEKWWLKEENMLGCYNLPPEREKLGAEDKKNCRSVKNRYGKIQHEQFCRDRRGEVTNFGSPSP